MLVGTKSITLSEALRNCRTPEQALKYAVECVPLPIRHVRAVVDNQRYLIATIINGAHKVPYVRRKAICDVLTRGVRVQGVVNELFDYSDLLACVDVDMWSKLLQREEQLKK